MLPESNYISTYFTGYCNSFYTLRTTDTIYFRQLTVLYSCMFEDKRSGLPGLPLYHIAVKFQGRKFSRLTSLKTFHELNFKD